MSWESVIALATVAQVLLLGAAAAVALVQMRHLRRQNDLAAFVELMKLFHSPEFQRAGTFVTNELAERLRDPAYRRDIAEGRMSAERHPEVLVLNQFNMAGLLNRFAGWDLIARWYSIPAPRYWKALLPVIALMRTRYPYYVMGFEELVINCRSLDLGKIRTQSYNRTPPALRSMWDETRREIERAYAEMAALDQANDEAS